MGLNDVGVQLCQIGFDATAVTFFCSRSLAFLMLMMWRTSPSLGVTNDDHSPVEITEADDSLFAILSSIVFDFMQHRVKDLDCVIEIQTSFFESLQSLVRIIRNSHNYCNYNN